MISSFLLAAALLQDAPVDIPKSDLPAKAPCAVCSYAGEEHGEEKPEAGVRYKGHTFYFCNKNEVATFKELPDAYLPLVFPWPAPAFAATTLDGKAVTLADYKDKVVLVDFWATWCAPCVKSMPEFDKLYAKHKGKGFEVLGVSIDTEKQKVKPFLAKRRVSYPVLLDDAKTPSWAAFKVRVVPTAYLINRKGEVVGRWIGEGKMKEMEAAIVKELGS